MYNFRYYTTERRKPTSSYAAIKRSCRERGTLYEDTEFPANSRSLYHHKKPSLSPIVWMRPHVSKHFCCNHNSGIEEQFDYQMSRERK